MIMIWHLFNHWVLGYILLFYLFVLSRAIYSNLYSYNALAYLEIF
jgi:hypothetical protein